MRTLSTMLAAAIALSSVHDVAAQSFVDVQRQQAQEYRRWAENQPISVPSPSRDSSAGHSQGSPVDELVGTAATLLILCALFDCASGARQASATQQPAPRTDPDAACAAYWVERNSFFAERGLCFTSPLGRATFPGLCTTNDAASIPVSDQEKLYLKGILAKEKELGCKIDRDHADMRLAARGSATRMIAAR